MRASGFLFANGKLYNHDDKNEQGNELVCTHRGPTSNPWQDGSSDRISSPKKLLRSPFTDYEPVKENITYIGFYIHPSDLVVIRPSILYKNRSIFEPM
ncbi:hypothetical protein [Paenibacillus sp. P46E]|uniref:hypothetical protein n=1 Tax=Paenibacillus sp. P46E TaxID=1349436 RepID=UPI0009391028|nr:hypothetical protein [Paenibacillus sp. P46E]OKP98788.1 hypothetical protein A3849_08590 [Paenibacillus sp. P46E]